MALLCVPAQTTIRAESEPAYARMLWHTLAMTRAQENVLAVVVSDQAATSQAPFRCGGVSSITDPSAEPALSDIQHVLANGGEGYLLARLDMARLARFRSYRQENGLLPALASDLAKLQERPLAAVAAHQRFDARHQLTPLEGNRNEGVSPKFQRLNTLIACRLWHQHQQRRQRELTHARAQLHRVGVVRVDLHHQQIIALDVLHRR